MPSSCKNRRSYGGARTAKDTANRILRKKALTDPAWAAHFAKKNAKARNNAAFMNMGAAANAMVNNKEQAKIQQRVNALQNTALNASKVATTIEAATNQAANQVNMISPAPYNASFNMVPKGNSGSSSSNLSEFNGLFQPQTTTINNGQAPGQTNNGLMSPGISNNVPANNKALNRSVNIIFEQSKKLQKLANNAQKIADELRSMSNTNKMGGSRRTRRRKN